MISIDQKCIAGWVHVYNVWCPASLDTNCPRCGRFTNMPIQPVHFEGYTRVIAALARCPRCGESSSAMIVGPAQASTQEEKKIEDLCIHPDPVIHRKSAIPEDSLPERLNRAYTATLNSYNEGNWSAAVTSARRTLEGVVKYALPEGSRGGTLATQLRALPGQIDLAKPILEIADAVKEGGNIGAHFDLERDPDREVAKACLDLLDYLMEYIYVLPRQIDAFHARMSKDDPKRANRGQSEAVDKEGKP